MSVTPEVGVAIATRDRPDSLRRCLESLASGTVLPAEVVVADQSSGPRTRHVLAEMGSRLPLSWVDGGAHGLAGAQNTAFRHGSAPVVAVIDDDCVADAGWIAKLGHRFTADQGLALVAGRVLPLAPAGERTEPVSSRTATERRELRGRAMPWLVGSGNNFAVRREWFEKVGGCDVRLGPGTPGQGALDMDLFYRILRGGGRASYEPQALVHHERTSTSGRRERRWTYGHGMGAMCVIRLRERDRFGLRLLAEWFGLRGRVLAAGLAGGRWEALGEEARVLGGTLAGMGHAARLPRDQGPCR